MNQAKEEYRKTQRELNRDQEILLVFNKFDLDNSGTIELNELYYMFKANGVQISKNELKKLFKLVDTNGSGSLSFDEFKQLCQNPLTEKIFRNWMVKLRQNQKTNGNLFSDPYLPYNMNRLLDHLSCLAKRELLVNKIDQNKLSYQKTDEDIKNFIKLFILDEGSKDSIVKEDVARLIEKELIPRSELENNSNPKQFQLSNIRGLQRLDSVFLDEITLKELMKLRKMKKKINTIEEISETDSINTDSSFSDEEIDRQDKLRHEKRESIANISQKEIEQMNTIDLIIKNAKERGIQEAQKQIKLTNARSSFNQIPEVRIKKGIKYNSLDMKSIAKVKKELKNKHLSQSIQSTQESQLVSRNNKNVQENKLDIQSELSKSVSNQSQMRFMNKREPKDEKINQCFIQIEIERIKQEQFQKKMQYFQQIQSEQPGKGLLKSKQLKYNSLMNKDSKMSDLLESLK